MVVTGACIAGVSDVGDYLSLAHDVTFSQTIGVAREVCVVEDQFFVGAELIDGRTAAFALKEFLNLAVCCGKYGSFSSGGNVDGVVNAAFRARCVKGVDELFRADSGDRDNEICRADEGCG